MSAANLSDRIIAFAASQRNRTEAAKKLGISRPDFYRYIKGKPPRKARAAKLEAALSADTPTTPPAQKVESVSLSRESVSLLRDVLLQLVQAIELDLQTGDSQVTPQTNPIADRRQG